MSQRKPPNPFLKYSNMAIQMVAVIGLSAYGGQKLDQHYLTKTPVFTIILSLLGIFFALYLVLRDFINPKNDTK